MRTEKQDSFACAGNAFPAQAKLYSLVVSSLVIASNGGIILFFLIPLKPNNCLGDITLNLCRHGVYRVAACA